MALYGVIGGRLPGAVLLAVLVGCGPEEPPPPESMDLGGFTLKGPGAISADGRQAVLREDREGAAATLSHPGLPVGQDAAQLMAGWELAVAPGNEDYFHVYVQDLSRPVLSEGGAPGRYGGVLSWDVREYRGSRVSLSFDLSSGFDDQGYESELVLSELRLVPEQGEP
jgi:hypothetical protein